jgi:hypothetical protein
MKTQSLIQKKDEFLKDHQLKIGGSLFFILIIVITYLINKSKQNKLNQFLHAHDFTETDFKTGNIIIPKLKTTKNKIVISKSNKINKKIVEEKTDAFEKFFNIKILNVEDEKQKTIIYIQI